MSAPIFALTVGASIGVGAVSAPMVGSMLSKPVTGEIVPVRLTDLIGYLTATGGAKARGLSESEPEIPGPDTGSLSPAPIVGTIEGEGKANTDNKRMLAVFSLLGGVAVAFSTFVLIRRVLK